MRKHLVRHLFALVAGLSVTTGCGKGEPRWAKTADQIDREQWKAACGRRVGTFTRTEEGRIEEAFQPEPGEAERLILDCELAYRSEGHSLVWARQSVAGSVSDPRVSAVREKQLALLLELLPQAVHPVLRQVAGARSVQDAKADGFYFRGGRDGASYPYEEWRIEVSSRPIR